MGSPRYISPVADASGEAPGVSAGAKHGPAPVRPHGSNPTWLLTVAAVGAVVLAVALLGWQYWPSDVFWLEAAGVPVMVSACIVDIRERRVPNVLVGSAFGAIVLALGMGLVVGGHGSQVVGAGVGAATFAVPLLGSNLISARHLPGLGDVKLAAVLGLLVGVVHPVLAGYGLAIALLLGVAFGALRRVRGAAHGTFAFAPALCLGSLVVLAAGPWWLSRLGVTSM